MINFLIILCFLILSGTTVQMKEQVIKEHFIPIKIYNWYKRQTGLKGDTFKVSCKFGIVDALVVCSCAS